MTTITRDSADHIAQMMTLLEQGKLEIADHCPECDLPVRILINDDHHLIVAIHEMQVGYRAECLIIGCEGYHIHDAEGKIKPIDY